jgi:hypothetical protein
MSGLRIVGFSAGRINCYFVNDWKKQSNIECSKEKSKLDNNFFLNSQLKEVLRREIQGLKVL